MMTFEYIHSGAPNTCVSVVIDEDSDIYQACEAFEQFMRGAGYAINGHIVYEEAPNVTH